jgi:hypothetical protein
MLKTSNTSKLIFDGRLFYTFITEIITAPKTAPNVCPAANKYPPAEPYPIGKETSAEYARYKERFGMRKKPASPAKIAIIVWSYTFRV